jgi:hypothetical protein
MFMKLSTDALMTDDERRGAREELEKLVDRLSGNDQKDAKDFVKKNKLGSYWYSPEYRRPHDLLKLAAVPIQEIYRTFSGPAHGTFSLQLYFNDDATVHDINPREHPNWNRRAIEASSRLLLEIGRTRDVWDNVGRRADYDKLLQRIVQSK